MFDIDVSGSFITKPQNVTVAVGDDAKIVCQSDIDAAVNWQVLLSSSASTSRERVCYNGEIVTGYIDKYSIDKPLVNQYNLVIRNVTYDDEGEYTCTERAGIGDSASAFLTVVEHRNSDDAGKDTV